MGHEALEIENWKLLRFEKELDFSYNNRVAFTGLPIDSIRLYFYLKENFGRPNINLSQATQLFLEKRVTIGDDWCFLFQSGNNFILVSGDDLINITVLSIEQPPEKLDFDIFSANISSIIDKVDLQDYEGSRYDIYLNYGYMIKSLIEDFKIKMSKKIHRPPEYRGIQRSEIESEDENVKYRWKEYALDYNVWLKGVIERASISMQIQILLPIYYESLVDLAFRIKLQKKYFEPFVNHGDSRIRQDIFQYFERLNINDKLIEIRNKCFSVDEKKFNTFLSKQTDKEKRKRRNKMLHGNSVFLKNLHLQYFLDENRYLIGFPDRHRAERVMSESLSETLINDDLSQLVDYYENLCNHFVDIFDDEGYFKKLTQGLVFGHNPRSGGAIALPIDKLENLFLPEDFV